MTARARCARISSELASAQCTFSTTSTSMAAALARTNTSHRRSRVRSFSSAAETRVKLGRRGDAEEVREQREALLILEIETREALLRCARGSRRRPCSRSGSGSGEGARRQGDRESCGRTRHRSSPARAPSCRRGHARTRKEGATSRRRVRRPDIRPRRGRRRCAGRRRPERPSSAARPTSGVRLRSRETSRRVSCWTAPVRAQARTGSVLPFESVLAEVLEREGSAANAPRAIADDDLTGAASAMRRAARFVVSPTAV